MSFSSPSEINGILRLFQIQHQLSAVDSEVETLNVTVSNESTPDQVLLSNLDAFTMYAVRMRAATGAGFGPFTLFIIRSTLEAGKCSCVCACVCVCVCLCVCARVCVYVSV